MPLTMSAGLYNAEGSFNYFVKTFISANGWPSGPISASAYFDWPTQNLTFPCVTVVHLGGRREDVAQGRIIDGANRTSAYRQRRMTEVSCWVDSQRNVNWVRDLRQLRDTVELMFNQNFAVQLYDIYSGTANPPTAGLLRIKGVSEAPAALDENPAIKRIRMLVNWEYLEKFP